jgi:uncharacterized RDD family membrane protein YckC
MPQLPTQGAAPALDTTAAVETPEHIRFRHRAAGPARRGLAYLLDFVVRIVIFLIISVALAMTGATGGQKASTGFQLLLLFALEWGYYVFFETLWAGRSPGKLVLRLRVIKEGGYSISFVDSLLRNLLRAADFLPGAYTLGILVMGVDERFRRLGDLVAGTMVVVEERQQVTAALRVTPPPTQAELEALPQRPALSADELDAIELFLRRAGSLSPAREAELADMIAPMLARRNQLTYASPVRLLQLLYHRSRLSPAKAPAKAPVTAPKLKVVP